MPISSFKVMDHMVTPMHKNSMPIIEAGWLAIRHKEDVINKLVNKIIVSDALLGSLGMDNIVFRLKERPTKMSPVRAADALAIATKKLIHNCTVIYLKTNINKNQYGR